jgi:CubicO group peptidase (beta-lactamase class C family)
MSKEAVKNILRIILLSGTAISLYFVPWPVVIAWVKPLPSTIQTQVDQAADYGFDGIIVHIDKKDKPSQTYTSGYKNKETKVPTDPNSLFKIASVGKLFQAVAVAKLVNQGRLSLDQSLQYYLPDLSQKIRNSNEITLRMLVQHRSGIPDYTYTHNYWANPKETDEENLDLIKNLPADFSPGADYGYSNTNYLLLGKIMNQILGYDNYTYIENQIIKPLNLDNTYSSIYDVDLDDVMSGYYVGYSGDLKSEDYGMLSTAEDLAKFIRALNNGSVFTDNKEQKIYSSIYVFEHTGLVPGYQTIAKYHPDVDAVVIQFTNTVDFEGYNWNMSEVMYNRIVEILKKNSARRTVTQSME